MKKHLPAIFLIIFFLCLLPTIAQAEYQPFKYQLNLGKSGNTNNFHLGISRTNSYNNNKVRFSWIINQHYNNHKFALEVGKNIITWKEKGKVYVTTGGAISNSSLGLQATIGGKIQLPQNISFYLENKIIGGPTSIEKNNQLYFGLQVGFPDSYYQQKLADQHPDWPPQIIKLIIQGKIKTKVYQQHPNWKPEILQAICQNKIKVGMTKKQVQASLGEPKTTIKEEDYEIWVYGKGTSNYVQDSANTVNNNSGNKLAAASFNHKQVSKYKSKYLLFSSEGILQTWY